MIDMWISQSRNVQVPSWNMFMTYLLARFYYHDFVHFWVTLGHKNHSKVTKISQT